MQLLSNKSDKDDKNVITVTKKIGELQFEDEEEDSFFTKVPIVFLSFLNHRHVSLFKYEQNDRMKKLALKDKIHSMFLKNIRRFL